jgi:hypothetical protein
MSDDTRRANVSDVPILKVQERVDVRFSSVRLGKLPFAVFYEQTHRGLYRVIGL